MKNHLPNPLVKLFFIRLLIQVQAVLKRKEEEDQQMKDVVQTLQLALEKEKTKVKDLKDQVQVLSALGGGCQVIFLLRGLATWVFCC